MVELLVVIAIATIGVVYTSSTGEEESKAMADKSAKDALDEAEGQGGIGILGIDVVARKMRRMVGLPAGAVSAETLAEYRGDEEYTPVSSGTDDWDREGALPGEWDETSDDDVAVREDWGMSISADEDTSWADHELQEQVIERAKLAAQMEDDDEADGSDMSMDDAQAAADAALTEEVLNLAGLDAEVEAEAEADEADLANDEVDNWLRDDAEETRAAADPAMDTRNAPIVEDFDPTQDQILIGYRPGEAGNGRIGIMEDPLRPGSAAVTLGGRCVAVVVDAFGIVMAHHIELVCEEDGDEQAAA